MHAALDAAMRSSDTLPSAQVVADMIQDEVKLGFFSPMDGWTIHITDLDPHSLAANGGLEDVSLVKKYEISDEDYVKREDNFRKWKADKLRADPTWSLAKEMKQKQDAQRMKCGLARERGLPLPPGPPLRLALPCTLPAFPSDPPRPPGDASILAGRIPTLYRRHPKRR